jgi:hypothetical protein
MNYDPTKNANNEQEKIYIKRKGKKRKKLLTKIKYSGFSISYPYILNKRKIKKLYHFF